MLHPVPSPDELEDIRELNRLFLILLQGRARQGVECLGLAANLAGALRDATLAVIHGMSAFPRALFVLDLESITAARQMIEPCADELGRARNALALTVLLTAWNMCRQRSFQARMFLGLSAREAAFLRTIPLSELHLLARSPEILRCAFPASEGLWTALLRHAGGGLPADLRLVGLQPQLVIRSDEAGASARPFASASA